MRVARRAGSHVAVSATETSTNTAMANVVGSSGVRPCHFAIGRRILLRERADDSTQVDDGLLDGHTRLQPAEGAKVAGGAGGQHAVRQLRQRLPQP